MNLKKEILASDDNVMLVATCHNVYILRRGDLCVLYCTVKKKKHDGTSYRCRAGLLAVA